MTKPTADTPVPRQLSEEERAHDVRAESGIDQEGTPLRSVNQQQEPKPKRASRVRKAKPVVETGRAIHDPALYAEMSRSYQSHEEANAALAAFLREVRALRQKHRIADVVTVASVSVEGVGTVATWGQNGHAPLASPLLAWALGASESEDRRTVERMRERGAAGGR